MKITTQRAHDYHTLTHEIHDDYVRTILTDRDGWFVTDRIGLRDRDEGSAYAICRNIDTIYDEMGWGE